MVVVIGAGAAGIILAVELVKKGKTVLLLEGGGADVEAASQEPYQSETTGIPHTGIHIGRFRAEGGSTTRWGGQILELDDFDFEPREGIPSSGWPFPKSELTDGYARAIELEGLSNAVLQDEAVWSRLGLAEPSFDANRRKRSAAASL